MCGATQTQLNALSQSQKGLLKENAKGKGGSSSCQQQSRACEIVMVRRERVCDNIDMRGQQVLGVKERAVGLQMGRQLVFLFVGL